MNNTPRITLQVHVDDITVSIQQFLDTQQSHISAFISEEIKRQLTQENIQAIIAKSISSLVEEAIVDVQKSYKLKQLLTQSIEKVIEDKLNE